MKNLTNTFKETVENVLEELKLKGGHYDTAKHLIRTEDDLQTFLLEHVGQPSKGNMVVAVETFKIRKREENLPEYEVFDNEYRDNKKSALELLLQEPIPQVLLDSLTSVYVNSKEIYEAFLEDKTRTITSLIKKKKLGNKKPSSDSFQLF